MKNEILAPALGVLVLVALAQPLEASCNAPFLITTVNLDTGSAAYVINPTVMPGHGGNGFGGSSVTGNFTGFFWALGFGDPLPGVGADNGLFEALRWFYPVFGYPAYLLTSWAKSPEIDTCIDVMGPLGDRCQVTFMQDVSTADGSGYFALVSTPDDPASGDFVLNDGEVDVTMVPQMGMPVLDSARDPANLVALELLLGGPTPESIAAGAYLSDAARCRGVAGGNDDPLNGLVVGYRVVLQVLPRGPGPPFDFRADRWQDASGGVRPLGMPSTITVVCEDDSDVYASYQLILDSDFASPLVSNTTTRIECGPNVAEPESRIRVEQESRQRSRSRSR